MSLKLVKNKIRAVKKIRQVTKAMEAVSAVKMRKSQERARSARPYAQAALDILSRITQSMDASAHPLVAPRTTVHKTLLIVITSDRGLAGGLNSALLRAVTRTMKEGGLTPQNSEAVTIGRKGREYFLRRGYSVHNHFERWGEGVEFTEPEELVANLANAYSAGAYDEVHLVYTNFLSTFRQEAVVRQFLPVDFSELTKIVANIASRNSAETRPSRSNALYTFEPDAETVLSILIPKLLAIELYHAVLEANASEHSARMVAMKNASDRARDVTHDLTLEYNKARQGAITAEVSELVGGIEAMG